MATFPEMLETFKRAVETCNTDAFLVLFTEDATYEDSVYGIFQGHADLKRMLRDVFHQDATDFRWDMDNPVCDGNVGCSLPFQFEIFASERGAGARSADGLRAVHFEGRPNCRLQRVGQRGGHVVASRCAGQSGDPLFAARGEEAARGARVRGPRQRLKL